MASLGGTLEEMRRRLLALTSELERREAEARAVLGGGVEGVLAVDGERRITYLNPQAERLLGTTPTRPAAASAATCCAPRAATAPIPATTAARWSTPARAAPAGRWNRCGCPAATAQVVLTTSAPSGGRAAAR